ncbi:uncharacterized protein CLUP02_17844 [Colletotrichum lupini]|uniref:Uncharacterized protein n=1 Tax=Colletotrichum lupini TaxID=145971 RepID=A0A9Q8SG78_9PEZI|nr:uncharacterized protein CLUP02_17844 [Colletotrichum lupini]UQC76331.1 hypothetical protein CLUP02_17844 [Colletotrichum lupini]
MPNSRRGRLYTVIRTSALHRRTEDVSRRHWGEPPSFYLCAKYTNYPVGVHGPPGPCGVISIYTDHGPRKRKPALPRACGPHGTERI